MHNVGLNIVGEDVLCVLIRETGKKKFREASSDTKDIIWLQFYNVALLK